MTKEVTGPEFRIKSANKARVSYQIDELLEEWRRWLTFCASLEDSTDFDPQTCTEAVRDGWCNLRKHEILREKTLVFLRNHFCGYEFILHQWPSHPHESNTSRLRTRVPVWIHRIEMLKSSLGYVLVPDGFWISQGRKMVEKIAESTAERAPEIAAGFLSGDYS